MSMFKPTTIPFWADITVEGEGTQNPIKPVTTPTSYQINENIIELDDDDTHAIQTKGTQGQQEST